MENESQIFISRKSGLRRELSTLDVFMVNIFGYSLGLALTTNPVFIGSFAPDSNIILVLFFGLLAALVSGITYGIFAAVMPRSGGDYVFISRSVSPLAGFLGSWGFTIAQLYGLAVNSNWAFSWALGPSAITYGNIISNKSLIDFGRAISTRNLSFLLSLAYILLIFLVALFGIKFTSRLFVVFFVIAITGTLLQGLAFFSTSHNQFISIFNEFMLKNQGIDNAYQLTTKLGAISHTSNTWIILKESFRTMPLGFLVFLGFSYSVYFGSEIIKPKKSQLIGIFGALAFGALIFMAVMGRYMQVVGPDFNASLATSAVTKKGIFPGGTSLTFFAGLLITSKPLNLIMNIGNLLWFALVPLVILQVCSRNIHAWSLDFLLPDKVSLTNKYGFPYYAGLIVMLISMLLSAITFFTGVTLIAAVALVALCYILAGLSASIFDYNKSSDYSVMPNFALKTIGGLSVTKLFGWLTIVFFSYILYACVKYPQLSGSTDNRAISMLIGIYSVGLIYFLWRKAWINQMLKRYGLDINHIWGKLPPY